MPSIREKEKKENGRPWQDSNLDFFTATRLLHRCSTTTVSPPIDLKPTQSMRGMGTAESNHSSYPAAGANLPELAWVGMS